MSEQRVDDATLQRVLDGDDVPEPTDAYRDLKDARLEIAALNTESIKDNNLRVELCKRVAGLAAEVAALKQERDEARKVALQAADRWEAAEALRDELVGALEEVQWSNDGGETMHEWCGWCTNPKSLGHAPNCVVSTALAHAKSRPSAGAGGITLTAPRGAGEE